MASWEEAELSNQKDENFRRDREDALNNAGVGASLLLVAVVARRIFFRA